MKTAISAFLWLVGLLYFGFVAMFLALGLLFVPPPKLFPAIRFLFRIQLLVIGVPLKVMGLENFDHRRNYIIMGNHESLFDVFAVPAAIPMHFVGLEAASHFSWPIWGWLTRKWGNIPLPRRDLARAKESIDQARRLLMAGVSIGVLPEGTRSLTGEVGTFKKGPFHLALSAKTDILPFALKGLFAFKSKHSWHLNPTRAYVVFGQPLAYESFQDCSVEDLRDRVHAAVVAIKQQIPPCSTPTAVTRNERKQNGEAD